MNNLQNFYDPSLSSKGRWKGKKHLHTTWAGNMCWRQQRSQPQNFLGEQIFWI